MPIPILTFENTSCAYFVWTGKAAQAFSLEKWKGKKKVFCTPVRKAVNPNSDKDYGEWFILLLFFITSTFPQLWRICVRNTASSIPWRGKWREKTHVTYIWIETALQQVTKPSTQLGPRCGSRASAPGPVRCSLCLHTLLHRDTQGFQAQYAAHHVSRMRLCVTGYSHSQIILIPFSWPSL